MWQAVPGFLSCLYGSELFNCEGWVLNGKRLTLFGGKYPLFLGVFVTQKNQWVSEGTEKKVSLRSP